MKLAIAAALLALTVSTPVFAQSKPIACAYDQLTPAERARIGEAIVREDVSGMDAATTLIATKIEICAKSRSLTAAQVELVRNYVNTKVSMDGHAAALTAKGLSEIPDKAWSRLTPEQQARSISDNATADVLFENIKVALGPARSRESFMLVSSYLSDRAFIAKFESAW